MTWKTFGAAAILMLGTTSVMAEKPREKPTPQEKFNRMDKNQDGKISVEEFVGKRTGDKEAKARAVFSKMDKNSDGFLTLDEFPTGPRSPKR